MIFFKKIHFQTEVYLVAISHLISLKVEGNDRDKTYFMTKHTNYKYNIMLFSLKNTGSTYLRR